MTTPPEVWLRGAVPGVPALLQPVAHSLLQCREEVAATLPGLSDMQLWTHPGDAASVEYHVAHAMGALDRLLTYARGEQLSESQAAALKDEAHFKFGSRKPEDLVEQFSAAVDRALAQIRGTAESSLLEPREVGRGKLPSTVIGLLFHAAEHTQRHVGQMATTAKIVRHGVTS
jgi:hypothetical protein